ncbi:hypothetical protein MAPG_11337, partial [Magnaporthiopsis poae ATCC 64411]
MACSGPQKVSEGKLDKLLEELKEVYDSEACEYQRCLKIVAQDLAHVLAQEAVRHLPIAARVKAWDSICGTAKRRQGDRLAAQAVRDKMIEQGENWEQHCNRYKISTTDLGYFQNRDELKRAFHDMLGARIILYFPNDAGKVLKLLDAAGYVSDKETKRMGGLEDLGRLRKLHEKMLDAPASSGVHPANDLNLDGSEKQFSGYGAIHMVVKVPERLQPRDLEPEAKAIWERCVVEIQAGTVIMHAWAEVEHDIAYKTHGREVSRDEKGMLDMLNGLALASEVGMRRFRSPDVSDSPATKLEEVRSWLHQFYIKKGWSKPSDWVDVDRLLDFLVEHHKNRRRKFLSLAEAACSTLHEAESRIGLKLDHLLPHVIIHKSVPTDLIEAACRRVGLLQAAYDGQEAVVRLLLEKGVDKESKDSDGDTPLSLAAIRGREAVVRLLLENGADREARNKNGSTPLLWAAARGHEAVVRLLLEKGASWEVKDDYGGTALSLAARQGHEAVVKLLRDEGAA